MRIISALSALALTAAVPGLALAQDAGLATGQVGGGSFRSILPLIFIGLLVYVGLRMFRRGGMGRGPGQSHDGDQGQNQGQNQGQGKPRGPFNKDYSRPDDPENMRDAYQRARASWDWLSQGGTKGKDMEAGPAMPVPDAPVGFDPEEFVAGAKAAYVRIRQALAQGERSEAEDFAEPGPLDSLAAQPGRLPNEFLLINARLMGVDTESGTTTATVYYDTLARAEGAEEPVQLREVWRFSRREDDPGSHWKLSGVEPMDQGPSETIEPTEPVGGPQ